MKFLLRKVREINFINRLGRTFIKEFSRLLKSLSYRWRVYGVVELEIGDIIFRYFSAADDPNVDSIYYDYNDEASELELFSLLAKEAEVIFDIGANTGLYSVISGASNSRAKIFAFEPYLTNYKRLEKNIELNNLTSVQLIKKALGDSNKTISFYVPKDGRISLVASAHEEFSNKFTFGNEVSYIEEEVEQTTLDSFVDSVKISQLSLIKLDVESHEIEVLKGAKNTIERFSPLILCEIFLEGDAERRYFFEDFVSTHHYHIYWVIESGVVFTDKITSNPAGRSFLFSKKKGVKNYYPRKEFASFVKDIS